MQRLKSYTHKNERRLLGARRSRVGARVQRALAVNYHTNGIVCGGTIRQMTCTNTQTHTRSKEEGRLTIQFILGERGFAQVSDAVGSWRIGDRGSGWVGVWGRGRKTVAFQRSGREVRQYYLFISANPTASLGDSIKSTFFLMEVGNTSGIKAEVAHGPTFTPGIKMSSDLNRTAPDHVKLKM